MLRRAALTAIAAGLCLGLSGCVLATKEQVTTIPVPHVASSGLNVSAHNGSILVHTGGPASVQIVATLRMTTDERLAATTISANRDTQGVLTVLATPPGGSWFSNEGCSFDISLPDAAGVTLKSNNGRIELTGSSGNALLRTSNGAIKVERHSGPLDADTSNGRIEVTSARGPVKAQTSNGSVRVSLAPEGAGPIDIDTSNGAVTLELSTSFSGLIAAKTSNGSITGPEPRSDSQTVTTLSKKRGHAKFQVGTSNQESVIDTSNGSITIRILP